MSDSPWTSPELIAARERLREAIEHLNGVQVEAGLLPEPPGGHAVMTHCVVVAGWQAIGETAWDDDTALHQYYVEPQSSWITLGLLEQAQAQLLHRVTDGDEEE